MIKNFLCKFVYLGCILSLIGGCAPTATNESGRIPIIYFSGDGNITALDRAELLFSEALILENPTEKMLDVAFLFAKNGDLLKSLEALKFVEEELISDQRFTDYTLLSVELNLQQGNVAEALHSVKKSRFQNLEKLLNRQNKRRVLSVKADINDEIGRPIASVGYSIDLVKTLESKTDIINVHNRIWRQLARQPFSILTECSNASNYDLAGWCQMATLNRKYQNNKSMQLAEYAEWLDNHQGHPAVRTPPSWFADLKASLDSYSQIAILLPMQGDYRGPSQTFLDGFLAAYYELDQQKNIQTLNLRIYDTSKQTIQQAYIDAISEGAEIVIGGIRKSEAMALTQLTSLSLPTISLNRINQLGLVQSKNLYQFGNTQEDEMMQISDSAWKKGFRRSILIFPDTSWGHQASEFFENDWITRGGILTSKTAYSDSTKDFTQFLKAPLHVDLSEKRGLNIKRFVNSQVVISPRRRQDIDFVVVLGYPESARQIKPALDFLYASDVPVFSSSKVYDGVQRDDLDKDLGGIQFTAMPWTLPGHLIKEFSLNEDMHTAYRQLYARGYDTFLVNRNLEILRSTKATPLYGATGLLTLEKGLIKRAVEWGEFKNGKVTNSFP